MIQAPPSVPWYLISSISIVYGFKKCCVSIAMDSSEDSVNVCITRKHRKWLEWRWY